jgi:hypothetical protein
MMHSSQTHRLTLFPFKEYLTMLKQATLAAVVLLTAMTAQSAFAGADCPANPKDQWLSELDMQKKIVNDYGWVIYKFKTDDECYEVYGMAPKEEVKPADAATPAVAPEMVKVEAYFNTATGEVVKKEMD